MRDAILVAFGGGIGAALRFLTGAALLRLLPSYPTAGTLIVNVFGSLVMGGLMGWFVSRTVTNEHTLYMFLCVGLLGGFTTFSAFSKDFVHLAMNGDLFKAFTYAFVSVVMSCAAFFVALTVAKRLLA
jgi:CrcB protein